MKEERTLLSADPVTDDSQIFDTEAFSPLSLGARAAMLLTPIIVFWLGALLIYLLLGWRTFSFFFANAAGNFIGAGKFVILSGALPNAPLGVWHLAGLVVYSDVSVALMVLSTIRVLYRMPVIGKPFSKMRASGWRILQYHPWIRRAAFWSVVLFVTAPFQGTGSILGTIIARMTGLSRVATVIAIGVGSGCGCAAIAVIAHLGRDHLAMLVDRPYLGIVFAVLLFASMYLVGRKLAGNSMPKDDKEDA